MMPRPAQRRAFVLLEVIVSLAILGFAVAALMRSFYQSIATARQMEVQTQAVFLAQQLLDEFEIFTPREGITEGGFGDGLSAYSYRVEMEYMHPKYRKVKDDDIDRFFAQREYHLEIYYDNGKTKPFMPIALDSAVMSFEKFSFNTKQSYAEY